MWDNGLEATMRPVKPSLVLIQDEIRKSFGWALEDDIESAENLANASVNPEPTFHYKVQ